MRNLNLVYYPALLLVFILSVQSCNNNQNIPFPSEKRDYITPVTRPFEFGESVPIEWEVVNENVTLSEPQPFDIDQLPSKPFDIGGPKPLKMPFEEKPFDFEALPDTVFDMASMPAQPLKFKTILMKPPEIVKAGMPLPKEGASGGIMDMNVNLGLIGSGQMVMKDHSGALWISSGQKLYRYDGTYFEIYGREQGLVVNYILSLAEDDQNRIWIGTRSGSLFLLDREANIMYEQTDAFPKGDVWSIDIDNEGDIWFERSGAGVYVISQKDQTIKQIGIEEGFSVGIIQDKHGLIWIPSSNGIHVIDKKDKKKFHITTENGLNQDGVSQILQDDFGNMWISQWRTVQILDSDRKSLKQLPEFWEEGNEFFGLLQGQNGKVWLGGSTGNLYSLDLKKGQWERFGIGVSNWIIDFAEDQDHEIWAISLNNGIFKLNQKLGKPQNLTTADGLSSTEIWSSHVDQDGKIWICTATNGIDIYDPKTKSLRHIGRDDKLKTSGTARIYKKSESEIWVMSRSPIINIIDSEKKTIRYLDTGLENVTFTPMFSQSEDQMWLGSFQGLFMVEDTKVLKIKNFGILEDATIYGLLKDQNGQLWAGTRESGIFVLSEDMKSLKPLSSKEGLVNDEVYVMKDLGEQKLWVGTFGGIDIIDIENKTLSSITSKDGLMANDVYELNEYEGDIYIGSSGGLDILRPVSHGDKTVFWNPVSYSRPQGLGYVDFNQFSSSFTENGQFWAAAESSAMIVIERPEMDTLPAGSSVTGIRILDEKYTFFNKELSKTIMNEADTLWMANSNGRSFSLNKKRVSDSLLLYQGDIEWNIVESENLLPENLQLPYNKNYLSFTFSGNDYSNPNHVKYRYILQGIDKNWSPVTTESTSENYRDLPPGSYTFKVAASSMNGVWGEPDEFSFTILPPWWQTWWAYTLYGIFFIAIVRGYTVYRSEILKRQNQLLEEKVKIRTDALQKSLKDLQSTQSQLIQSEKMASLGELTAGIAHEIQNPLNFVNNFAEVNSELITEMIEELEKGNWDEVKALATDIDENEKKIQYHGKRADGIVKGMLQHSRNSSGVKELTDINILADEYLRLAYHGLRAKDKTFNATMNTDFEENLGKVSVLPQDMGRVILNLITNAFYTVNKKRLENTGDSSDYTPTVTVATKKDGNKIRISVSDNGNGIPKDVVDKIFQPFFTTKPSGEGTGLGLSMSYDIVTKSHDGELKVETTPGEGTTFHIVLPV